MKRRDFLGLGAGAMAGLAFASPFAAAKPFTDSGGRKISVPDEVHRVFPAGPPASVTLFTLAPEKMLGWSRAPSPEARSFLPARYGDLPEIGRLTGRGNTVNLENVVRLAPDLVLDVGSTTANYVSLADQVQEQTHIPSVLIGGRLAETPRTLRTIGDLLGVSSRAEALAGYAEAVLGRVQEAITQIPSEERPSIYVARGPTGLETAVACSIASEVVDLLGARNVVGKDSASRTIVEVSPEQLLAWQPDVILTIDRRFHTAIRTDARAQSGAGREHPSRTRTSVFMARRSAGAQSADRPPMARQAALSRLLPAGHPRRGPPFLCPLLPAGAQRRTARRTSHRSVGVSILPLLVSKGSLHGIFYTPRCKLSR